MYALIYEGEQVYIGCAVSPEKRLKQHRKRRPEGDAITLKVLSWHKDRGGALTREYKLIKKHSPAWNVIYSPAVAEKKRAERHAIEFAAWEALAAKNQAAMDAANDCAKSWQRCRNRNSRFGD